MEKQTKLLENIRSNFTDVPIIVVESKADVMRTEGEAVRISSVTGEGMQELADMLMKDFREIFRRKAKETPLED